MPRMIQRRHLPSQQLGLDSPLPPQSHPFAEVGTFLDNLMASARKSYVIQPPPPWIPLHNGPSDRPTDRPPPLLHASRHTADAFPQMITMITSQNQEQLTASRPLDYV
ncbi:hypothetical protein CFIO01_10934 [Colletotrichum fioriniae PJ7]|uniref:Uncharacterized protein n=1 Tax=Colletotrichum fioriniae PJ7 TaxID=1445577 RepID=A0A010RHZ4_9PEZI|nr:hypothetical protein CFIO01_10934 [Colletotrichum fioriniae PJ7]